MQSFCGLWNEVLTLVALALSIPLKSHAGKLVVVAGRGYGKAPDQFGEAHFMAMNARGDIYIADTVLNRVVKFGKP